MKKIVVGIASFLFISIGLFATIFIIETMAVSRDNTKIEFVIEKGDTYLNIAPILKENNLIKSEFFYKLYIKLTNPKEIQAGKYELSESMSVKDMIKTLEKGNTYNPNIVKFTIPEGKHMVDVSKIISSVTDYTEDELLTFWNSEEFINKVINKYWFITNEIIQDGIRYPLEGYFFPDTYEIDKTNLIENITYKMLDRMDAVLTEYKSDILKSDYSVHNLLTLASIVEHEAILDEDRSIIASVFYNRLNNSMKLQSCATIGYAIDEWKLTYSKIDLEVDSPYNTYVYAGLPIGPGNMMGKKSIEATIYPSETEYFYFLANVCDTSSKKTYFSKTYDEHLEKKDTYLNCVD